MSDWNQQATQLRTANVELLARKMFNDYCLACLDHAVKTDCTMHLWADLTDDEKSVWRAVASKALTWVARHYTPSLS